MMFRTAADTWDSRPSVDDPRFIAQRDIIIAFMASLSEPLPDTSGDDYSAVRERAGLLLLDAYDERVRLAMTLDVITAEAAASGWCGYSAPFLGRCACGDAKNHEPGGRYYMEGRLPDGVDPS